METNLIEWQAIWQTQKPKPMKINELISRLNSVERRAKTQRLIMFTAFAVLVVTSILRPAEVFNEVYYLVAFALLISAIGIKLFFSYRSKYGYINNEADLSNQTFIKQLDKKLDFNTNHLLSFLFLATLSLNFALLGLYEKGTIFNFDFNAENRVFIHMSTLVILFIGSIVNFRRLKQSRGELSLLMNQLKGTA